MQLRTAPWRCWSPAGYQTERKKGEGNCIIQGTSSHPPSFSAFPNFFRLIAPFLTCNLNVQWVEISVILLAIVAMRKPAANPEELPVGRRPLGVRSMQRKLCSDFSNEEGTQEEPLQIRKRTFCIASVYLLFIFLSNVFFI